MALKPIFCRQGSKGWIADKIIKLFPKNYADLTYIEPFVGGGSIYFFKNKSVKEILNDKDKSLIDGYRLVKKANIKDIEKYKDRKTLEEYRDFIKETSGNYTDKLAREIVKKNNTFNSLPHTKIYQTKNPYCKLKNLEKYQERMKNTVLYSWDYRKVINRYDSINTFIYLDPPYEDGDKAKVYIHSSFNHKQFADYLKTIKSKWLLSLNDSPTIRELFKDFKIISIQVHKGNNKNGSLFRNELLIKNY